jgi:transcriptional regulator with XRE-family HTH domain
MGHGNSQPATAGERIKQARMAKRLSKSELARRVGVPRRYIQRWENEGVLPTSAEGLDGLIRELDLRLSDLVEEPAPGLIEDLRAVQADLAAVRKSQRSIEARLRALEASRPPRKQR